MIDGPRQAPIIPRQDVVMRIVLGALLDELGEGVGGGEKDEEDAT